MGDEILKNAYFHGAHGLLAVADLTRRATVEDFVEWVESATDVAGPIPVVALNKADLAPEAPDRREEVRWLARAYLWKSSARPRRRDNVEEAFRTLAKRVARPRLGVGL